MAPEPLGPRGTECVVDQAHQAEPDGGQGEGEPKRHRKTRHLRQEGEGQDPREEEEKEDPGAERDLAAGVVGPAEAGLVQEAQEEREGEAGGAVGYN
ncbi:MAG: hypothetical protein K6U03_10440 [Firmicutes bacterium]|nr:hypothetical protein [Bacillota bacterium]